MHGNIEHALRVTQLTPPLSSLSSSLLEVIVVTPPVLVLAPTGHAAWIPGSTVKHSPS